MTGEEILAVLRPVVEAIARSIHRRLPTNAVDLEDLISEGWIGAQEFSIRFDSSRGIPIQLASKWRIRGAILDYLRSLDFVSRKERQSIKQENSQPVHLCPLEEAIKEPCCEWRDLFSNKEHLTKLFRSARLPRRYRRVLKQYFYSERNMRNIARTFRICESRVSQIISTSIKKLRAAHVRISTRHPRFCKCGRELKQGRKKFCSLACCRAGAETCIESGCDFPVYKQRVTENGKVRFRGRRCRFHFRVHKSDLARAERLGKPLWWKKKQSQKVMAAYRRRHPKLSPEELRKRRGSYVLNRSPEEGRAIMIRAWETRRLKACSTNR